MKNLEQLRIVRGKMSKLQINKKNKLKKSTNPFFNIQTKTNFFNILKIKPRTIMKIIRVKIKYYEIIKRIN